MDVKTGDCPLGAKCVDIKDNVQIHCPWYAKIQGKNPQSEEMLDEYRCAIAWLPLLMVEHSLFERQTGSSVESFRNEMVKQNIQLINSAKLKGLDHA
jgi:hypothetical protein